MASYHDKIIERLQQTKQHWRTISRLSGVPYTTLTKVAQRVSASPQISTLEKLDKGVAQFIRLRKKIAADARRELRGLSKAPSPADPETPQPATAP